MRKIILTITAIVCLLTPTYAREWNQENLATVAATIAYYHENCGDVPPKGLAAANAVAEGLDHSAMTVAIMNVLFMADRVGQEEFCKRLAPGIAKFN